MKICIPTETGEGKNAQVYGHFGSAPYFTIYDTDAQSIEIVDNANSHHEHGTCNPWPRSREELSMSWSPAAWAPGPS